MTRQITIENIEAMRRRAGIADLDLLQAIRSLKVGDCIKVTLLSGTKGAATETLLVRITGIRGGEFRGCLAERPGCAAFSRISTRRELTFTAEHIHSLPPRRAAQETTAKPATGLRRKRGRGIVAPRRASAR